MATLKMCVTSISRNSAKAKARGGGWKGVVHTYVCPYCGRFQYTQKRKSVGCSSACTNQTDYRVQCLKCGKENRRTLSYLKKFKRHFCNRTCFKQYIVGE